jgi:hypothetical protein
LARHPALPSPWIPGPRIEFEEQIENQIGSVKMSILAYKPKIMSKNLHTIIPYLLFSFLYSLFSIVFVPFLKSNNKSQILNNIPDYLFPCLLACTVPQAHVIA